MAGMASMLGGLVASLGAWAAVHVARVGYDRPILRLLILVSCLPLGWFVLIAGAIARLVLSGPQVEPGSPHVADAITGLGATAQAIGMAWLGYRVYRVVRLGSEGDT